MWNQASWDPRNSERNFCNCVYRNLKSQDFNGVWIRDQVIPVRRSNKLSYEATNVGSWSFVVCNGPARDKCEVIYEMFHIKNCRCEIKWAIIIAVMSTILPVWQSRRLSEAPLNQEHTAAPWCYGQHSGLWIQWSEFKSRWDLCFATLLKAKGETYSRH